MFADYMVCILLKNELDFTKLNIFAFWIYFLFVYYFYKYGFRFFFGGNWTFLWNGVELRNMVCSFLGLCRLPKLYTIELEFVSFFCVACHPRVLVLSLGRGISDEQKSFGGKCKTQPAKYFPILDEDCQNFPRFSELTPIFQSSRNCLQKVWHIKITINPAPVWQTWREICEIYQKEKKTSHVINFIPYKI